MQNSNRLAIIIVNYQSQAYLRTCLESIYRQIKSMPCEIVVVNNDEQEDILALKKDFPEIKIIKTEKNIGFGRGANLGVENSRGEWLLFLNPDTELLSDHAKTIRLFEKISAVGIIGPKLVDENDVLQEWIAGAEITLGSLICNKFGFGQSKKIWESAVSREADWISGAVLTIRRELFAELKGFDENIFMYFEDVDLCRRARAAGKKIIYFPEEKIRHWGGRSSADKKAQKKNYYTAQDYYFCKHYGRTYAGLVRFLRKIFVS